MTSNRPPHSLVLAADRHQRQLIRPLTPTKPSPGQHLGERHPNNRPLMQGTILWGSSSYRWKRHPSNQWLSSGISHQSTPAITVETVNSLAACVAGIAQSHVHPRTPMVHDSDFLYLRFVYHLFSYPDASLWYHNSYPFHHSFSISFQTKYSYIQDGHQIFSETSSSWLAGVVAPFECDML